MHNDFNSKIEEEFNRQKNFSEIMSKVERKVDIMKLKYVLAPVCVVVIGAVGIIGMNNLKTINNENEVAKSDVATNDYIVINNIEDMAMAKLMVDSKVLEAEDLPDDISFMSNLQISDEIKLNSIFAYYTKSDYSLEEFDVLHDYVFFYVDGNGEKSIKISLSKEGNPLRDYFFNTTNDISKIAGADVVVSRYETKYIVTLNHKDINFDIETEGLNEEEMIQIVTKLINAE